MKLCILICLIVFSLCAAQCPPDSTLYSNLVQLTQVSSYYNQSTTEDLWIYISKSFATSYYLIADDFAILLPETTSSSVSGYCSGLTISSALPVVSMPFLLTMYTTGINKVCLNTTIDIQALSVDEWFHVTSIFYSGKKEYYINKIHYGTVDHSGCQGAKYLLALNKKRGGIYLRNYRVWATKVDINFILNNMLITSLYGSLPPRHFYKLDEITGDVIDYGESGLNLVGNDLLYLNNVEEHIAVHKSFPYANNFTQSYSQFQNGAAYMKDGAIQLPNVMRMISPTTKQISISFMFQLESVLNNTSNVQLMKSYTIQNTIETQHLYANASYLNASGLLFVSGSISNLPFVNDLAWKYVCISLTEFQTENDEEQLVSAVYMKILLDNNIYSSNVSTDNFILESSLGEIFTENSMLSFPLFAGYIREVKVWSKALSNEEFMSHLFILDNCVSFPYLVSYWPFNNSNGNFSDVCETFTINATQNGIINRNNTKPSIVVKPWYYNYSISSTSQYYYMLYKYVMSISLPGSSTVPLSLSFWIYIREPPVEDCVIIDNKWQMKVMASDANSLFATVNIYDFTFVQVWAIYLPYKVWNYIGITLNVTTTEIEFSVYYEFKNTIEKLSQNMTGINSATIKIGSDTVINPHFIIIRDINIWSYPLEAQQIAESKYKFYYPPSIENLFAKYTMQFSEFGGNAINLDADVGTNIQNTADTGDPKIPHYSMLNLCATGYITNGIECIPPQKVFYSNKWMQLFSFDPSKSQGISNELLEFWFYIFGDEVDGHFLLLRDLTQSPINGFDSYKTNLINEVATGIYFYITANYDADSIVTSHSITMRSYTGVTPTFEGTITTASKLSFGWRHFALISANKDATNSSYFLKMVIHDDSSVISDDLIYSEALSSEVNKIITANLSMLLNPRLMFYKELRVRPLGMKFTPATSLIRALSHKEVGDSLLYLPMNDGVGKILNAVTGNRVTFNYTSDDFIVWVESPEILVVCSEDYSYSYKLNKCAQKKSVTYIDTEVNILENHILSAISTANGQDFVIGVWIKKTDACTSDANGSILIVLGSDTAANLIDTTKNDNLVARLACVKEASEITLKLTIPNKVYDYTLPLLFDTSAWNYYILKSAVATRSLYVNGILLASSLFTDIAPVLSITLVTLPFIANVFIKDLMFNLNSTFPLNPIVPFSRNNINQQYNIPFYFASFSSDEDEYSYIYNAYSSGGWITSTINKVQYSLTYANNVNDVDIQDSYLEIKQVTTDTPTLDYTMSSTSISTSLLTYDMWINMDGPIQLIIIDTGYSTVWDSTFKILLNYGSVITLENAWAINTWYHYYYVFQSGNLTLYNSNNVIQTNITYTINTGTSITFTFGSTSTNYYRFKNIRLFNKALTRRELFYYDHTSRIVDTCIASSIEFLNSNTYAYLNSNGKRQLTNIIPLSATYLASVKNEKKESNAFLCKHGRYFNGVECIVPKGVVFDVSATRNTLGLKIPLNVSIPNIKKNLEWTFETWFNLNVSNAGFADLILIGLQGKQALISLRINSSDKIEGRFDYYSVVNSISSIYLKKTWVHAAYTTKQNLSKISHTIFLNGVNVITSTFTLPTTRYSFENVLIANSTTTSYAVILKELRIWNKALSSEDLAKFMFSKYRVPCANLIYYFPFDSKVSIDSNGQGMVDYGDYFYTDKKFQYDKPKIVDLAYIGKLMICGEDTYWSNDKYQCIKFPELILNRVLLIQGYNLNVTPSAYVAIDWTIEAWINILALTGSDSNIFEQRVCSESVSLKRIQDQYNLVFRHSTNYFNEFVIPFEITKWAHYAFVYTYSLKSLSVYLNGIKFETQNMTIQQLKSCKIVFGEYMGTSEIAFKLAEFRIWGTPRTGSRIKVGMNRRIEDTSDLLLYMKLNDGNTSILDYSNRKYPIVANLSSWIPVNAWIEENEIKFCTRNLVYSISQHACVENKQLVVKDPYVIPINTIDIAVSNEFTIGFWMKINYIACGTAVKLINLFGEMVSIRYLCNDTDSTDFSYDYYLNEVKLYQVQKYSINTKTNWGLVALSIITKIKKPYTMIYSNKVLMQSHISGLILDFNLFTESSIKINPTEITNYSVAFQDLRIYNRYIPIQLILPIFVGRDTSYSSNLLAYISFQYNDTLLEEVANKAIPLNDDYDWCTTPLIPYSTVHPTKLITNESSSIQLEAAVNTTFDMSTLKTASFSLTFWLRIMSYDPTQTNYTIYILQDVNSPYRRTDFYTSMQLSTALPSYSLSVWSCQDYTSDALETDASFKYFASTGEVMLGEWFNIGYTFTLASPSAFRGYYNGIKVIFSNTSVLSPPSSAVPPYNLIFFKNTGASYEIKYQIDRIQAYDIVLTPSQFASSLQKQPNLLQEHLVYYLASLPSILTVVELKRYMAIDNGQYYENDTVVNNADISYSIISTLHTTPSTFPMQVCSSNEAYSKFLLKCIPNAKKLRWQQGVTDSVNITIDKPERQFCIEFWATLSLLYSSNDFNSTLLSSPIMDGDTSIIAHYTSESSVEIALEILALNYSQYLTTIPLYTDKWHHYAISYNFQNTVNDSLQALLHINRCIFTIDGKQMLLVKLNNVTSNNPNPLLSTTISIGSKTLSGSIAELRIWNKFRSAGMIGYQMHHKISKDEQSAYMMYYFPMNESEGTIIEDELSKSMAVQITTVATNYTNPVWNYMDTPLKVCDMYYNEERDECTPLGQLMIDTNAISTISLATSEQFGIKDFTIMFLVLDKADYSVSIENSNQTKLLEIVADNSARSSKCMEKPVGTSGAPKDFWSSVAVGFKYSTLKVTFSLGGAVSTVFLTDVEAFNYFSYTTLSIMISKTQVRKLSIWNKYMLDIMGVEKLNRASTFNFNAFDYYSLIAYYPLDQLYSKYIRDISRYGDSTYFSSLKWTTAPLSKYLFLELECKSPSHSIIELDTLVKACRPLSYADPILDTLTCSNAQLYSANDLYNQIKSENPYCVSCTNGYLAEDFFGTCVSACTDVQTLDTFENICISPLSTLILLNNSGIITCITGTILIDGNCIANCQDGLYLIVDTNGTQKCVSKEEVFCQTVEEQTGTPECTKCIDGYLPKVTPTFNDSCYPAIYCTNTSEMIKPYMDCFDRNNKDGDGCSSQCTKEPHFNCVLQEGYTKCDPIPGDGFLYPGESCDYNTTEYGADHLNCKCDATECTIINSAIACNWINDTNAVDTSYGYSDCFTGASVSSVSYTDLTYMTLIIQYSAAIYINESYANESILCVKLFKNDSDFTSSYASLGIDPICKVSATTLTIKLGTNNTIQSLSSIYYNKNNILKPVVGAGVSLKVDLPLIPKQAITANVVFPTASPKCEDLIFKIYGISGLLNKAIQTMEISCTYAYISSTNEATSETFTQRFIETDAGSGTYLVTIDSVSLHSNTSYICHFNLLSCLGDTFAKDHVVNVNSSSVPQISFDDVATDIKDIAVSSMVSIKANGSLVSCDDSTNMLLNMSWHYGSSNDSSINPLAIPSPNNKVLYIPPYTLKPGIIYQYYAVASYNGANYSKTLMLRVVQGPLIAKIDNGTKIIIGINETKTISALSSYDMDTFSNSGLAYKWECKKEDFVTNCPSFTSSIANSISIQGSKLGLGKSYLQLKISKDSRSVVTNLEVDCISAETTNIRIKDISPVKREKKSVTDKYIYEAIVDTTNFTAIIYNWTLSLQNENIFNKVGKFITILPNTMKSGNAYKLSCEVTDNSNQSNSIIGSASLSIAANSNPIPGIITITPNEGNAYTTVFNIYANGFYDEDTPLTYQFSIKKSYFSKYIPITTKRLTSSFESILPEGDEEGQNLLYVMVEVEDTYGATTQLETQVRVNSVETLATKKYEKIMAEADHSTDFILKFESLSFIPTIITQPIPSSDVCGGCNSPNGYCNNATRSCVCQNDYNAISDCSLTAEQFSEEKSVISDALSKLYEVHDKINSTSNEDTEIVSIISILAKKQMLSNGDKGNINAIMDTILENDKIRRNNKLPSLPINTLDDIVQIISKSQINKTVDGISNIETQLKSITYSMLKYTAPNGNAISISTDSLSMNTLKMSNTVGITANLISSFGASVSLNTAKVLNANTTYSTMTSTEDTSYCLELTQWIYPKYAEFSGHIRSNIVSISVVDLNTETETPITSISSPVSLVLPYSPVATDVKEIGYYRCYYYDTALSNLSDKGITFEGLDLNTNSIKCTSNHLTDFMIGIPVLVMNDTPKIPNITTDILKSYALAISPSFWFTLIITIIIIILAIWTVWKDKTDSIKYASMYDHQKFMKTNLHLLNEERHVQAQITEPVSIVMEESKDESVDRSMEKNATKMQTVFMKKTKVNESSQWMQKMPPISACKLFCEMMLHSNSYLSVVSVYYVKLTRLCRVFALHTRLMLMLLIISAFFAKEIKGFNPSKSVGVKFVVSIISLIILTPIDIVLKKILTTNSAKDKKTKALSKFTKKQVTAEEELISKKDKKKRLAGLILCMVLSFISIGVVNYISYSIKNDKTNHLMLCALIGLMADAFIVQIVKGSILYAILQYIGKSTSSGGKKRKSLLSMLPASLIEILK